MLSEPNAATQTDVPMDTIWSVLEAANELGDSHTVEACRRVIDANLRGEAARQADLVAVAAFFA